MWKGIVIVFISPSEFIIKHWICWLFFIWLFSKLPFKDNMKYPGYKSLEFFPTLKAATRTPCWQPHISSNPLLGAKIIKYNAYFLLSVSSLSSSTHKKPIWASLYPLKIRMTIPFMESIRMILAKLSVIAMILFAGEIIALSPILRISLRWILTHIIINLFHEICFNFKR